MPAFADTGRHHGLAVHLHHPNMGPSFTLGELRMDLKLAIVRTFARTGSELAATEARTFAVLVEELSPLQGVSLQSEHSSTSTPRCS